MRAKKTFKEYRGVEAINNIVAVNKLLRADFQVKQSNYTTEIFYPDTNMKHKFVLRDLNKSVFIAHAKMKKDVMNFANESFFNENFEKSTTLFLANHTKKITSEVINFDLNNAYPTALLKSGLISEDSAKYIGNRKKIERLQSIGIFASRKTVFEYIQGYLCNVYEEESNLKNVYFFAAKVTDNIMKAAREVVGKDFLFYWFDGIYFENNQDTSQRLFNFFKKNNIQFKFEILSDFQKIDSTEKTRFLYTDSKGGRKNFIIPNRNHDARINKYIFNLLNT